MMDYRIYRGTFDIPDEREFLAKIREIAESGGVYIVFLDSSAVAGCNHIRTALSLAERSFFENKNPISNFFEMEVLLYALGTRQTGVAARYGIHEGGNDSYILVCRRKTEEKNERKGTEDRISRPDSSPASGPFDNVAARAAGRISELEESSGGGFMPVLDGECLDIQEERSPEKISRLSEIFSITPEEIAICGSRRIEELVIERCVLLDVNR